MFHSVLSVDEAQAVGWWLHFPQKGPGTWKASKDVSLSVSCRAVHNLGDVYVFLIYPIFVVQKPRKMGDTVVMHHDAPK
jgi:hypothetical protein